MGRTAGWQHFKLVRAYGDCYWVDKVLDTGDTDILYGPRQSRNTVMDNVLADINFACENITMNANSQVAYNKYVALAIKSRVCLFEGTYCKYVLNDEARAKSYLTEAKNASLELMNSVTWIMLSLQENWQNGPRKKILILPVF